MIRTGPSFADKPLPLLVEPGNGVSNCPADLLIWLDEHKSWLDDQLYRCGAVLLRGFGIATDQDFEPLCRKLVPELKLYLEGNSPRRHTSDFVYTSTNYPAEFNISMHSELSYVSSPPQRLFFYCQVPAAKGGETPLTDCRRVLDLLDPAGLRRFEERGIKYVQQIHGGAGPGRSWQETFETTHRGEGDRYSARGGVTG